MIDDLLTYSRLDSRAQPPEPIDCSEMLGEVLSDLKASVDEADAKVQWTELQKIWAERTQIHQLFQNLIGNAVKYRSDKPPTIVIDAIQRHGEWLFSVKDNGIGIPTEFLEKIFELLKRQHGRDKYPGTGIGLAICRKIVQRHHGRIWAESIPGAGSTFYFTLPGGHEDEGQRNPSSKMTNR